MIDLATPPLEAPNYATNHHVPDRLVVACVYWGDKYTADYVYRLKRAVERNLTIPHRFVCLTSKQLDGIECVKPVHKKLEGWWQKVFLFGSWLFEPGSRVLYLDLDMVITGNLDNLVTLVSDEPLIMLENFYPNRRHCAHNSSMMLWNADDPRLEPITACFDAKVTKALHGDQCWLWRVLRTNIANFPNSQIISYQYHVRDKHLPGAAKVVVFHGQPNPHEVSDPWIKTHWF